jgi:hypothetical protein
MTHIRHACNTVVGGFFFEENIVVVGVDGQQPAGTSYIVVVSSRARRISTLLHSACKEFLSHAWIRHTPDIVAPFIVDDGILCVELMNSTSIG